MPHCSTQCGPIEPAPSPASRLSRRRRRRRGSSHGPCRVHYLCSLPRQLRRRSSSSPSSSPVVSPLASLAPARPPASPASPPSAAAAAAHSPAPQSSPYALRWWHRGAEVHPPLPLHRRRHPGTIRRRRRRRRHRRSRLRRLGPGRGRSGKCTQPGHRLRRRHPSSRAHLSLRSRHRTGTNCCRISLWSHALLGAIRLRLLQPSAGTRLPHERHPSSQPRPLHQPPPHKPLQPHDRPQPPQLGSRCLITLLHPPPEVREAHRAALLPLAQLLGLGRRRRRRIIDRPLVPTTMPSMLHLSRVPEDNEHAMQLHRVASGSSKLTGNAGDIPQLPVVQGPPPPPGPGTTSARRLAALHRASRAGTYLLTS